jgi:hypothetical protein
MSICYSGFKNTLRFAVLAPAVISAWNCSRDLACNYFDPCRPPRPVGREARPVSPTPAVLMAIKAAESPASFSLTSQPSVESVDIPATHTVPTTQNDHQAAIQSWWEIYRSLSSQTKYIPFQLSEYASNMYVSKLCRVHRFVFQIKVFWQTKIVRYRYYTVYTYLNFVTREHFMLSNLRIKIQEVLWESIGRGRVYSTYTWLL